MILPCGVHTIASIYHPDVQAGLPDGRYVAAVAEPFTGNRLTAAWWVLTGRAYALRWPRPGDLEAAFSGRPGSGVAADAIAPPLVPVRGRIVMPNAIVPTSNDADDR
jgi:hypothetical protein